MGQEGEREERGNGRSPELGCRGGNESKQATYMVERGESRMGKIDRQTCLKIKVLRWPRLIFHHNPKLKM